MSRPIPSIPEVIKALDSIMGSDPNLEDMQSFSESLNLLSSVDPKIKQKFYDNLSQSDPSKIRRSLDFIEYLTIHSPERLSEIIQDEKFVELFPFTLTEEDLKDPALNLLKLWTETYEDRRYEMSNMFNFIEGLDMFDIHLPPVYRPSYENNMNIKRENYVNTYPYSYVSSYPPRSKPNTSASSFIEKATKLRDSLKEFLESKDYDDTLFESIDFFDELRDIMMEASEINSNDATKEERLKIQDVLNELNYYEVIFRQKLHQQPNDQENPQQNDYRILISDSENLVPDGAVMDTMMDMQDFLSYKTYPCSRGMDCPYFDISEGESGHMRDQMEQKCPYWHSENDKRRAVMTEDNATSYLPKMCGHAKNCALGDKCRMSHNFFEVFFHPDNYKTDFCGNPPSECPQEKYCSSFHSEHERETWKKMKKKYENSQNEQDNELTGWNQEGMDIESGPVRSGHYPRELNVVTGGYPFQRKEEGKGDGEIEKKEEKKETVSLKGQLHAKLKIRKSYNNPNVYTDFFQKNKCFDGVPLFNSGERSEGGVNSNGEVNGDMRK